MELNTCTVGRGKFGYAERVRSMSEMADIFNTGDEIFLVFTEKSKYPLYTFFHSHFLLILLGSVHLVGMILGVKAVCT